MMCMSKECMQRLWRISWLISYIWDLPQSWHRFFQGPITFCFCQHGKRKNQLMILLFTMLTEILLQVMPWLRHITCVSISAYRGDKVYKDKVFAFSYTVIFYVIGAMTWFRSNKKSRWLRGVLWYWFRCWAFCKKNLMIIKIIFILKYLSDCNLENNMYE